MMTTEQAAEKILECIKERGRMMAEIEQQAVRATDRALEAERERDEARRCINGMGETQAKMLYEIIALKDRNALLERFAEAFKDEHGGKHYEPECSICVALSALHEPMPRIANPALVAQKLDYPGQFDFVPDNPLAPDAVREAQQRVREAVNDPNPNRVREAVAQRTLHAAGVLCVGCRHNIRLVLGRDLRFTLCHEAPYGLCNADPLRRAYPDVFGELQIQTEQI